MKKCSPSSTMISQSLIFLIVSMVVVPLSSFPLNLPISKPNINSIFSVRTLSSEKVPQNFSQLQSKKISSSFSDVDKDLILSEDISDGEAFINLQRTVGEGLDTNNFIRSDKQDELATPQPSVNYSTILTLCFFVAILSALDRVAMSIAILPLSSELHLTETIKGQIASAFSAGYGLAIIPCGLLVSSFSPRITMAIGVSLWSFATLLTPWATSFISSTASSADPTNLMSSSQQTILFNGIVPLLLVRGVVGAAESFVLPTTQRFLANWVPEEQKSSAVAVIFAGFQTGTIAAYLLTPNIIDYFGGWRELFFLYGIIGIAWLAPWLTWAKDSPSSDDLILPPEFNDDIENCKLVNTGSEDGASLVLDCEATNMKNGNNESNVASENNNLGEINAIQILKLAPWNNLLKSPAVIAITVAHAANNWGLCNNLAWTPTFYAEQYGLNVRDSAFLSIVPSIAGAIGGLFSGNLADYMIKQEWFDINKDGYIDTTVIRKGFQGTALLGSSLCLAILSSSMPDSPTTAQLLLTGTVGLQAFNAAGYGASTQEKAGEKWTGLLYSVTTLPGVVLGAFGVYLTGQILDATNNNWSLVFACNAGVNVIGALAFIFFYNSKREFD